MVAMVKLWVNSFAFSSICGGQVWPVSVIQLIFSNENLWEIFNFVSYKCTWFAQFPFVQKMLQSNEKYPVYNLVWPLTSALETLSHIGINCQTVVCLETSPQNSKMWRYSISWRFLLCRYLIVSQFGLNPGHMFSGLQVLALQVISLP